MPRDNLLKGRVSIPGQIYHLTICTAGRKCWFTDFRCARIVVQRMRQLHDDRFMDSLAWVLMPDHLHWLIQLGEGKRLADVVRLFKGGSARDLNRYLHQQGSIWQRGYYDHALRREEDIKQVARYLVANPLRANMVQHIEEYPHWDAIWLQDS